MNDSNKNSGDSPASHRSESQRSDHKRAERAVRSTNISLADQRRSGRTLGFLGLSTFGHVAILVALAAMPAAIQEIQGGGNESSGAGGVTMTDSTTGLATDISAGMAPSQPAKSVEVSVMTDESSDITRIVTELPLKKELPQKTALSQPVELPKKKELPPKSKATATAVTKPIVESPEQAEEAPPVLLANPPSDDEPAPAAAAAVAATESVTESVSEDTAPQIEETVETPASPVEPETVESANEAEPSSAIQAVQSELRVSERSESNSGTNNAGTGLENSSSGSDNSGSGAAGAFAGPIRDASELKALGGNPNPIYPARDRLARKEGTAIILGRISPDGRVVETTLEKSSGSANMDAASIQAFRGWRFQAGQQGWVRKPFQFRLVGEAKEVPAPLGKGLKR